VHVQAFETAPSLRRPADGTGSDAMAARKKNKKETETLDDLELPSQE
jgi:hypothetical protein